MTAGRRLFTRVILRAGILPRKAHSPTQLPAEAPSLTGRPGGRYSLARSESDPSHPTPGHTVASHPLKDFVIKFKAGETVYRDGDPGAEMFIVQSGAVRIFRDLGGQEQVLAEMEKGDFFGEMSVLEGLPRTANARALEDCELIEINSTVFDRMIRGNIEIAVRMLRKLSTRLQEANHRVEELAAAGPHTPASSPLDLDRPPEPTSEPVAGPVPEPAPEQVSEPPESAIPPAPAAAATGGEGAIPFGPDWLGVLVLEDGQRIFPIRGESSLIGRYDPVTGTRPEIDLTAYDTNRSVSRRHAKVTAQGDALFVSEEVGALNGTFLNGKRLTPGKPEQIRTGDTLALGMVTLRFEGKARPA